MTKDKASVARNVMAAVIFTCTTAAWATLEYRGRNGLIRADLVAQGTQTIIEYYVPMLAAVLGFFLARPTKKMKAAAKDAPMAAYVVAGIAVLIWAVLPVLYFGTKRYETAEFFLDKVKLWGTAVGSVALVYFFSQPGSD